MDHPSIARVLDGGATVTGRPFFVMELVRGVRITDYCQANQLSLRERLGLFIQLCHAIQHAHQKGVIHRDLKPSNVLVTVQDGKPVPKVIDFGIAKAIEEPLTEKTVLTNFHAFIGTPAYTSPEQAEMTGSDVDTRSDIYSLGVLLYELLTGVTPFDAKELTQSGLDGMRRMIKEVEPPKPSTRLRRVLAGKLGQPADHAGGSGSGLDRHEVSGEGSHSPLRNRAGTGRRPPALLKPGTGLGSAAEHGLSLAQSHSTSPHCICRRGRDIPRGRGWEHRQCLAGRASDARRARCGTGPKNAKKCFARKRNRSENGLWKANRGRSSTNMSPTSISPTTQSSPATWPEPPTCWPNTAPKVPSDSNGDTYGMRRKETTTGFSRKRHPVFCPWRTRRNGWRSDCTIPFASTTRKPAAW